MRITREFILKFAQDIIERRARSGRDLLAVYLCGSFLGETYSLGGAADVDLFFVHVDPPELDREIIRITDDIHLDIAHFSQRDYRDTRHLRVHPWMGPSLNTSKILYDPQHFLDFVQASVRGQYDRPDHIYERARVQAVQAREIWFRIQGETNVLSPEIVREYLTAIENAANAVASLSGPPLPERRLLNEYPARAEALDRPGLFHGLMGLLGSARLDLGVLKNWLISWSEAYHFLPAQTAPVKLHPYRLNYYRSALEEFADDERPATLLWILLSTWTQIAIQYPGDSPQRANWQQALGQLGLVGDDLRERIQALDSYLDLVEETLEAWAKNNGAWEMV